MKGTAMKTLIFNGSPRRSGDTAYLIERLCGGLDGEVRIIDAYEAGVQPCIDCRHCQRESGCVIHDRMDSIYRDISEADRIIIASPVHFSELSGQLLALLSRIQALYASERFLGVSLTGKPKLGGVILCGGGDGSPKQAEGTARILLKFMGAKHIMTVCSLRTDSLPSRSDSEAIARIDELARLMNLGGIAIRPISEGEIDECVRVIRESFGTVAREFGFTPENAPRFTAFAVDVARLTAQLADGRPMFACRDGEKIVGYYSLCCLDECELNNLCVLPEYRHRNIGRNLLFHAFDEARRRGYERLNIGIVEENKRLREWYERYGFVHTGARKYDFFPFTCGYMSREL